MPFTAAHPAIVLPLKKLNERWFSTTGLVIGSITPDFSYFLSFALNTRISSHQLPDVFTFNLPVTIVLALLYHGIIKESLIEHLPPFFKRRANPAKQSNWLKYLYKHWAVFLGSALIGILSHLLWDSFTHFEGYFANKIPWLLDQISFFGINITASRLMQHLSTIVGIIYIAFYITSLPTYAINTTSKWVFYWFLVIATGILVLVMYMPEIVLIITIDELVVRFITGCLTALLFFGVLWKLKPKKENGHPKS
jgi:hypothetical protein